MGLATTSADRFVLVDEFLIGNQVGGGGEKPFALTDIGLGATAGKVLGFDTLANLRLTHCNRL